MSFANLKKTFTPGMIVAVLGFCGLTYGLIDKGGGIGGKVPVTVFFLAVIVIGIVIMMLPKEKFDDLYGEVGSRSEYA